MVKQLGIPTYFLTLSCADLRWEELPYIINKLNNPGLSEEELKNLSYQGRCNLSSNNPVLVARHFQYKVEVFFKEIIIDSPLGKTKYYAIRIKSKEGSSPHVHSFIWILNAPDIQNEAAYIKVIEQTINAPLPDPLNDPELFELVKTYQVHAHSRNCWKYNKRECRFSYSRFFTEKTIIAKPLDSELTNDEKQEVLAWRKTLLKKVKKSIDDNLNPAKLNVIDPTKDNFTQPSSIQEILDELEISMDNYCKAFSVSKDDDLEIHLKRQPNSYFVNNYFDVGLESWQENIDIQPVFNEYKAVTSMCQYFSKTEDQCSQAMRQAVKEAYENNMHHHDTMKTIAKAYLGSRECSVQGAVYHILPELKLRRIFPAVYFVNTNLPEQRVQVLLAESELPDDSPNIFKKSNIDRYVERPSATYCNGKYSALNDFCYAEFLAYYTLENKSSNSREYQPDELDDSLIEKNHDESSYSKQIKLMISGERMRCHKVRRILRYHVPNKILYPEKFAHHVLLLFYPFKDEKELLSGLPPLYQNKLQEQGVQGIVNINKIKIEPYGDLVDEVYSRLNETLINNQDPHSQIENDEIPEVEYPNDNDSEDTETN